MKMDLGPLKPYVGPAFRQGDQALDPVLKERMQRPMRVGAIIIAVFVVGLIGWAAVSPISSAVVSPGIVRVEANRKTIRHREGGTVRAINVHEGQRVKAGQVLMQLDDVQARAAVDVLQSQYDTALAQAARFKAESTGRGGIEFPAALTARIADPRVAGVIRDQQFLFTSRGQFLSSQADVLGQRLDQLKTQIEGTQAQIDALDVSVRLTNEELAGYQTLYEKGYAPKTVILRYERNLSDLAGRRGALIAESTRLRQQIGETRIQLNSIREERVSQAAEGVRQMESALSEVSPRLTAANQMLQGTRVKSPVDGYVLGLSQFTIGGVVGSGEHLMDIVPANAPLIVSARIKPEEIDNVKVGMTAQVRLTGLNANKVSPVDGKVMAVSADQIVDEKSGVGYMRVDIHISPSEISKLPKDAKLTPGMPAQVMIVTGKRTILSYVVSPLTDTVRDALREE